MTGTMMFVHGTGNWDGRRPGARGTLDGIVEQVGRGIVGTAFEAFAVVAPAWAEACAVPWPDVSVCLPLQTLTRSATAEPQTAPAHADLWELLARDPLLELRLAGLVAQGDSAMVPGVVSVDAAAAQTVRSAVPDGALLAALQVLTTAFAEAAGWVGDSEELAAAARASGMLSDPSVLDMAARAVVGRLLSRAAASDGMSFGDAVPAFAASSAATDQLFEVARAALGEGAYRGIVPTPLRSALVGLAARVGTAWAVPHRGRLMDPVTTFAADIAFYLAHGSAVRAFLSDQLTRCEPPVVVLAHSLGGIAMVDLLSDPHRPEPSRVGLLVTAGSQAPYLYLVDALQYLRPDASTVGPFTPWLNVYNRKDLLSFCAERVFAGVAGVRDVEVDPGVPFPQAHSAYWPAPGLWTAMEEAWSQGLSAKPRPGWRSS